jgi:hypothetical protein
MLMPAHSQPQSQKGQDEPGLSGTLTKQSRGETPHRCWGSARLVPGIQEVWRAAMNHTSHLDLTSQKSSCHFALPPIHLFWGGEPQNQCIYFYHYLLLFNEIKNRAERDLPALTTQE